MLKIIIAICIMLMPMSLVQAQETEENITIGKRVWLEVDTKKFLAIYTTTEEKTNKGSIIILHDEGGSPDQKNLIHDIRTQLPGHNWATFSLQMPLLEVNADKEDYYALFPSAQARIKAAISYLVEAQVENIVLLGVGMGGLISLYVLNENTDEIKAAVVIGLPVPNTEHKSVQVIDFLTQIEIPILDLYSYFDVEPVVSSARKRRLAAKKNKYYRQDEISLGNSTTLYQNEFLIRRIHGWLSIMLPKIVKTNVIK